MWTAICENAFKNLKQALIEVPSLLLPTCDGKFELYTDASDIAIGGAFESHYGTGIANIGVFPGKTSEVFGGFNL
ncbi:unnamed protein product [Absidia cylindrospora]